MSLKLMVFESRWSWKQYYHYIGWNPNIFGYCFINETFLYAKLQESGSSFQKKSLHELVINILSIRDLDKLNLIWRFDFRFKPIFATALNVSNFKSGQRWLKNNHFSSTTRTLSKSLIQYVIPAKRPLCINFLFL